MTNITKILEKFSIKHFGKILLITSLSSGSKESLINFFIIILLLILINKYNIKKIKSSISNFFNNDDNTDNKKKDRKQDIKVSSIKKDINILDDNEKVKSKSQKNISIDISRKNEEKKDEIDDVCTCFCHIPFLCTCPCGKNKKFLNENELNGDSYEKPIDLESLGKNNLNLPNRIRDKIIIADNENVNVKNNIKILCKKFDDEEIKKRVKIYGPYSNEVDDIENDYNIPPPNHDFIINVNPSVCTMPIFNLRTHDNIDFHYNFILHNFDPKKINDLIMCKDIHKFMSTSSLTSDDIPDELAPVYFIKKQNDVTDVFEYLKVFIYTDESNNKISFITKGNDYLYVKRDINKLIEKELIDDLLSDKHYIYYNLSVNDGVTQFLDKLLSLVTIPEKLIGDNVKLDIENYYENKKAFEYHYNVLNNNSNMFKTTI
jgi:hypothetical protein